MRFEIESSCYYDTNDELLEEYPCLKDYGFEVEKKVYVKTTKIRDDEGNILEQEYEKPVYTPYIYIYGLEELKNLTKSVHAPLIVSWVDDHGTIEIYDGYRE